MRWMYLTLLLFGLSSPVLAQNDSLGFGVKIRPAFILRVYGSEQLVLPNLGLEATFRRNLQNNNFRSNLNLRLNVWLNLLSSGFVVANLDGMIGFPFSLADQQFNVLLGVGIGYAFVNLFPALQNSRDLIINSVVGAEWRLDPNVAVGLEWNWIYYFSGGWGHIYSLGVRFYP